MPIRNREENEREKIALYQFEAYNHVHAHTSTAIRQCEWSNHKNTRNLNQNRPFSSVLFANLSVCLLLCTVSICLSFVGEWLVSQSIFIRLTTYFHNRLLSKIKKVKLDKFKFIKFCLWIDNRKSISMENWEILLIPFCLHSVLNELGNKSSSK